MKEPSVVEDGQKLPEGDISTLPICNIESLRDHYSKHPTRHGPIRSIESCVLIYVYFRGDVSGGIWSLSKHIARSDTSLGVIVFVDVFLFLRLCASCGKRGSFSLLFLCFSRSSFFSSSCG